MEQNHAFGHEPLGKLLKEQAIPAAIGILIMSIYGIVDTIFVGRWVGTIGIGAITVVLPISFLISSVGMAVGVGGASIISRAFGAENYKKANDCFGNQISLTLALGISFSILGFYFSENVLNLFGGKGELLQTSKDYFHIILLGVPFLAWAMMSNNIIRAEGFPRVAMYILIIPAILNIILDPILIIWLDMGIKGAAWATSLGYVASALYAIYFFTSREGALRVNASTLRIQWPLIKEIFAIGSVTLARQGTNSLLSIVLNNVLFAFGGALAMGVYGIISRMIMFVHFPTFGITQGMVPILGFNYGAKKSDRVNNLMSLSFRTSTIIAIVMFTLLMVFTPQLVSIFTTDQELIQATVKALRLVFLMMPLLAINLIGSAYFQAIGKAMPALLLTLTRQGFFLIPLLLILPKFFDLNGVWYSFPIADFTAAAVSFWYLRKSNVSVLKA